MHRISILYKTVFYVEVLQWSISSLLLNLEHYGYQIICNKMGSGKNDKIEYILQAENHVRVL